MKGKNILVAHVTIKPKREDIWKGISNQFIKGKIIPHVTIKKLYKYILLIGDYSLKFKENKTLMKNINCLLEKNNSDNLSIPTILIRYCFIPCHLLAFEIFNKFRKKEKWPGPIASKSSILKIICEKNKSKDEICCFKKKEYFRNKIMFRIYWH